MKYKIQYFFLLTLIIFACNSKQTNKNKDTENIDNDTLIQYSKSELISFLDSIGELPEENLLKYTWKYPDSIFRNRKVLNIDIDKDNFEKLKTACKKGFIDKKTFPLIFPDKNIDSIFEQDDSVPISYYSFGKNKDSFDEFAFCFGNENQDYTPELFFLKNNKIISVHEIYHNFGLEIESYIDTDGKTVIYYKEVFERGTGIWWNNFYFYKYDGQNLLPILNVIENTNLQIPWDYRAFWFESKILNTNPLTLKFIYYTKLEYPPYEQWADILNDSATVEYTWNEKLKILEGNYSKSKISGTQMLTYYLDSNELLFIGSNYETLKSIMNGNEEDKKSALFIYLNGIKNRFAKEKI